MATMTLDDRTVTGRCTSRGGEPNWRCVPPSKVYTDLSLNSFDSPTSNWRRVRPVHQSSVDEINHQLDRIALLPAGWDGYRSPRVDRSIIEAARRVGEEVSRFRFASPRVVPLSRGSIQFELAHEDRLLELEFEDAETIRYLKWQPSARVAEEQSFLAADFAFIADLASWLRSG